MFFTWAWAVGLTFLGSYLAFTTTTSGPQVVLRGDESEEILDMRSSMQLMVSASIGLMTLYFLINYLVYIILVGYGIGASTSLSEMFEPYCKSLFGKYDQEFRLFCSACKGKRSEFLSLSIGIAFALYWFVNRRGPHAWILQNLFGACLVLKMQKLIQIPNLKIATFLLCLFFFYDIFFVFISPYLFAKNVMVTVGTGGDTGEKMPMVFVFPKILDELGRESILGLGDVAFPGFLTTFLRKIDLTQNSYGLNGYFIPGIIGYAFGLAFTMFILLVFNYAQPALLYLVPCTLLPTYYIAMKKKELNLLWNFDNISEKPTKIENEELSQFINDEEKS